MGEEGRDAKFAYREFLEIIGSNKSIVKHKTDFFEVFFVRYESEEAELEKTIKKHPIMLLKCCQSSLNLAKNHLGMFFSKNPFYQQVDLSQALAYLFACLEFGIASTHTVGKLSDKYYAYVERSLLPLFAEIKGLFSGRGIDTSPIKKRIEEIIKEKSNKISETQIILLGKINSVFA